MKTTAHAVLRDRLHWRGRRRALAVSRNGDLELMGIPAPADGKPIELPGPYPYERQVSGLALGPCESIFVADTAHDRILYVDGRCDARSWLPSDADLASAAPGHFAAPRGLAVGAQGLWVADHGNHSLQHLAFPRLESNLAYGIVHAPTSIAVDARGALLVVGNDPPRLQRILPGGEPDDAFAVALGHSPLRAPHAVAVRATGELIVSDTVANTVLLLDADGTVLGALSGPSGWLPGALASAGTRTYVADAASGWILIFEDGELQGRIESWRGPVCALAVAASGDLFVKPGTDARYFRLTENAACASEGELRAGPFDAGEEQVWARAWIDAEASAPAAVELEVALGETADDPDGSMWRTLPSADTLLSETPYGSGRFAWMRVRLRAASLRDAPRVHQIRLATAAEDYLDYLPLTYRRNDVTGFLSRWLKLLRGEFGRIEEAIDMLPRVADPDFVPPDAIEWLAQWLGFELPSVADETERRALIADATRLYARRGTPASIAGFVEMHTGIRPAIVESFGQRRVWVLGTSSRLDFDTRLPHLEPMGMVVPDAEATTDHPGPIGSAVVGASGPLAPYQLGLPLFADEAHRFCVVTDAYRVREPGVLDELHRIVEREKPAHTDYRVQVVSPELRIGLQSRIGIDAIVGEEPGAGLDAVSLGVDSRLAANDVARIGSTTLDGSLTLS